MNIDKKQKDELDLAFNESTINYVGIESDSVEILLSCISMNADKEFPDDNRLKIVFSDYGRIAISYRKGTWDDENAEIEEIKPDELKSKFDGLILDSMYGWAFINLEEKQFTDWSDKISLDKINNSNWSDMNTIDLFAEQVGKDEITIDIRIWFIDFRVFDFKNTELSKKEFAENAQRGWNQMYETGIETENHKSKKMK